MDAAGLPADESITEKKELLSKSELSIWLDVYDDVFSDFDSRPFTDRALSDDFLNEVRKMVREKPTGNVELKLLIPVGQRHAETESIIVKNLHTYFRHAAHSTETEMKQTRRRGLQLTGVGFLLMIITAYVVSFSDKKFYLNMLQIIMEPAGWFMVWTGLENIFVRARTLKPIMDFNVKMAKAQITFLPY